MVYSGDEDGIDDGTITGYLNGEAFGTVDGLGTLYAHTDAIRVGGVAAQTHFDPDHSSLDAGGTPYGNDGGVFDPPVQAQSPYFFTGSIDDVVLYDKALSADRIQAHFDARDYVRGDFDRNGELEFADFLLLRDNFNTDGASYTDGDVNFDGSVDLDDFFIWRNAFNPPAAAAAAVPEPSTSWMLMGAGLLLPLVRRRNR